MIEFNKENYLRTARDLFLTDSPTGYTARVIEYIKKRVENAGYSCRVTNKGTLEVCVDGKDNTRSVATSAHVDTLGLMVRSVKSDGTLALTKLGGPITATLDGEYCTVHTREGKDFTGTILSTSPAVHVYPDANTLPRDIDHLIVRIDEKVSTAREVRNLGIENGDIVFIDPKFTITESGFLKSRFIDDKASVIALLLLLDDLSEKRIVPRYRTFIYFSVYEEVGHGAASIDDSISEFVTCDMGCVGMDLSGNEYSVSICAKDSGGPYDYELTSRLIALAQKNDIRYTVDIFPFYGSDVGAAYRSGKDVKGALIGTGVSASHGMERTHEEGIVNTLKLLYAYLCE